MRSPLGVSTISRSSGSNRAFDFERLRCAMMCTCMPLICDLRGSGLRGRSMDTHVGDRKDRNVGEEFFFQRRADLIGFIH